MISAPHNIYGINVFKIFVDEISIGRAAKILDVTERSIFRWLATEKVPKAAVLALYWESNYGRSLINVEHDREIKDLRGRMRCYEQQFLRAKEIIAGLRAMNYGTANEPFYDASGEFTLRGPETNLSVLDSDGEKLTVSPPAKAGSAQKQKPRQATV